MLCLYLGPGHCSLQCCAMACLLLFIILYIKLSLFGPVPCCDHLIGEERAGCFTFHPSLCTLPLGVIGMLCSIIKIFPRLLFYYLILFYETYLPRESFRFWILSDTLAYMGLGGWPPLAPATKINQGVYLPNVARKCTFGPLHPSHSRSLIRICTGHILNSQGC